MARRRICFFKSWNGVHVLLHFYWQSNTIIRLFCPRPPDRPYMYVCQPSQNAESYWVPYVSKVSNIILTRRKIIFIYRYKLCQKLLAPFFFQRHDLPLPESMIVALHQRELAASENNPRKPQAPYIASASLFSNQINVIFAGRWRRKRWRRRTRVKGKRKEGERRGRGEKGGRGGKGGEEEKGGKRRGRRRRRRVYLYKEIAKYIFRFL